MEREKRTGMNKKWLMKYMLPLVLVIAVGIGLYSVIGERNVPVETGHMQFTEKSFEGMAITKRFPEEVAEKEPEQEPEKEVAQESVKEEVVEPIKEKVEEVVDVPVAPEKDLSTIIANAKNYVYTIDSDLEQGSGFLFNTKGDIVTNAHVAKDASYIIVTSSDGQEFEGQVIGISETVDIALIRVPHLAGKEPVAMEMSKVRTGIDVFALGSPENIANTSTEGKILSIGKSFVDDFNYDHLYEMNATIKKGSSGGPLIDAKTERILGINSLVLQDDPSIGYAIPIYTVINQLREWAENPDIEEQEEVVEEEPSNVEESLFKDKLLRNYINNYYKLIPHSLNDATVEDYLSYLLPGSPAVEEGEKLIDQYRGEERVFDAVQTSIKEIHIGIEEAEIVVDATFLYHDQDNDEVYEIVHEAHYAVVVDEYGDYSIKEILIKQQ